MLTSAGDIRMPTKTSLKAILEYNARKDKKGTGPLHITTNIGLLQWAYNNIITDKVKFDEIREDKYDAPIVLKIDDYLNKETGERCIFVVFSSKRLLNTFYLQYVTNNDEGIPGSSDGIYFFLIFYPICITVVHIYFNNYFLMQAHIV